MICHTCSCVQVLRMLAHMDEWAFDMFEFADVTGQQPLSTLGFAIIKRSGIMSSLKLDEGKLAR